MPSRTMSTSAAMRPSTPFTRPASRPSSRSPPSLLVSQLLRDLRLIRRRVVTDCAPADLSRLPQSVQTGKEVRMCACECVCVGVCACAGRGKRRRSAWGMAGTCPEALDPTHLHGRALASSCRIVTTTRGRRRVRLLCSSVERRTTHARRICKQFQRVSLRQAPLCPASTRLNVRHLRSCWIPKVSGCRAVQECWIRINTRIKSRLPA